MSYRGGPPPGLKRETWRPKPTSSWTPGQTDSSSSRPAPGVSPAGPSKPASPRARSPHVSSNQRFGPNDRRVDDSPRKIDRGRDATEQNRSFTARAGPEERERDGRDWGSWNRLVRDSIRDEERDRNRGGPSSWRPGDDPDGRGGRYDRDRERDRDSWSRPNDRWRPEDGGRRQDEFGRERDPPGATSYRQDRFDDRDRSTARYRDDFDGVNGDRRRDRSPPRFGQTRRFEDRSPIRDRRVTDRRRSPDYTTGGAVDSGRRRSPSPERDEPLSRERPPSPRRSPSPPPRARSPSPFSRKRGPPSPRRSEPKRPRDTSPSPSATSSRFRPSPSRSSSPGQYSVLRRSVSPPVRRRPTPSPPPPKCGPVDSQDSSRHFSPTPPRRRSPSPRRFVNRQRPLSRSPPPFRRDPQFADYYRAGDDSPPRRARTPPFRITAQRNASTLRDGVQSNSTQSSAVRKATEEARTETTSGSSFEKQVELIQKRNDQFANGHLPLKFESYRNGQAVDEPQASPVRDSSPSKGGWKPISNGHTHPPPPPPQSQVHPFPSQNNGPPPQNHAQWHDLSTIAPYIHTAFRQWITQNASPALPDFLVHYFGRAPDVKEISQMQQLLDSPPPGPNTQYMGENGGNLAHNGPNMSQTQWSPGQGSGEPRRSWNDRRHSTSPHKASLSPIKAGAVSPAKSDYSNHSRYGRPPPTEPRAESIPPSPSFPPPVPGPPPRSPPPPPPSSEAFVPRPRSRRTSEATTKADDPVETHKVLPPGETYERLTCVGEGTYGKVYKARDVTTGRFVALKRIRMEGEKDGFPVTAMREIKLLQSLKHPNVLHLIEMMVSKGSVYMVLEYMDHDLTGLLAHPEIEMSAGNIKSLNHQMLSGLAYLHDRGILHRDMKGSNILLSGRGELKLADFGLARVYSKRKRDDYTNRVITLWYRSPELLLGETVYGPEVDMWSAGCIMLELFCKKPVFQSNDEINQLEVIHSIMGTPNELDWPGVTNLPWYELVKPKEELPSRFRDLFAKWLSPAGIDLAEGLLTFDPSKRLSAGAALQAAYFTSEEPPMEMPTQLADCGEHHEMSAKIERHRRRQEGK